MRVDEGRKTRQRNRIIQLGVIDQFDKESRKNLRNVIEDHE